MKLITLALIFLSLFLVAAPASAQTLTNHAVAVGRGSAVQGFAAVGPGSSNTVLLGQGGSANPSFGQVPNAALTNSATTVNGQTCTLGSTCTIPTRPALSSSATYYVRTDGNDTACTGLTDAAYVSGSFPQNCAVATWQQGVTLVQQLDFNGFDVTLKAGAEAGTKTWTLSDCITIRMLVSSGAGHLIVTGNGDNTVLSATGGTGAICLANAVVQVNLGDLKITSSSDGYGAVVVNGLSTLGCETVGPNFGSANNSHVWVHDNQAQFICLNSTLKLSGGAAYEFVASDGGLIFFEGNSVGLFSGAVTFSGASMLALENGYIQSAGTTWAGATINGKKFDIRDGGVINPEGGGLNYFPGTSAGTNCAGAYSGYPSVPCGLITPADNSGAGLTFTNNDSMYMQSEGGGSYVSLFFEYPVTADATQASIAGLPTATSGHNWASVECLTTANDVAYYGRTTAGAGTLTFYTLAGAAAKNSDFSNLFMRINCTYAGNP